MLKVNVGLSRKLTQDYNSTGFSVNIEGEVSVPPNDAESVIHGIKELYDLAEEALDLQVERHRSDSANASHDGPQRQSSDRHTGYSSNGNGVSNGNGTAHGSRQSYRESSNNDSRSNGNGEPATQKQTNYLLSLGKRHRLSTMALEQRIQEILGEEVGIYQLTKREAARVIDDLTGESSRPSR